ncbi:MAG: hypothetical protein ACRC9L_10170, partial [Brevinema sp.]
IVYFADKKVMEGDELGDSPHCWPSRVSVPKGMRLRELPTRNPRFRGYVYETDNYQVYSDAALSDEAQKSIGQLFECAYTANQALAKVLPIPRAHGAGRTKNKFQVRLFQRTRDYVAESGVPGSRGYYRFNLYDDQELSERSLNGDEVLVPFESLGLTKNGRLAGNKIQSGTLVHELTHQYTILNRLPVWADEGISEYLAYVRYNGKVLDFDQCFKAIVKNARQQKNKLHYPFTLEEFFLMEQDEMLNYMVHDVDTYILATLCFSYFAHLQGDSGVTALKNYMEELIEGSNNKKAIQKLYGNHQNSRAMQQAFLKAWETRGITIKLKK